MKLSVILYFCLFSYSYCKTGGVLTSLVRQFDFIEIETVKFNCTYSKRFKLLYNNSVNAPTLNVFIPKDSPFKTIYSQGGSFILTQGEQFKLDSQISQFIKNSLNNKTKRNFTVNGNSYGNNLNNLLYVPARRTHYSMIGSTFYYQAFLQLREARQSSYSLLKFHKHMRKLGYLDHPISTQVNEETYKSIRRYKRALDLPTKQRYLEHEIKQIYIELTTQADEIQKSKDTLEVLINDPSIDIDLANTLDILTFKSPSEFKAKCFNEMYSLFKSFGKTFGLNFECRTKQLLHPVEFLRLAYVVGLGQISNYDHFLEKSTWIDLDDLKKLPWASNPNASSKEGQYVSLPIDDSVVYLRDESYLYNSYLPIAIPKDTPDRIKVIYNIVK